MNETNKNIKCENNLNLLKKKDKKYNSFTTPLTKQIFFGTGNIIFHAFVYFMYVHVLRSGGVCRTWNMVDIRG